MSMCGVFILCRGPGWKKSMQFFSSLHFERIYLKKDYYYGTPQEIYDKLRVELNAVDKKIAEYKSQASELLKKMQYLFFLQKRN